MIDVEHMPVIFLIQGTLNWQCLYIWFRFCSIREIQSTQCHRIIHDKHTES